MIRSVKFKLFLGIILILSIFLGGIFTYGSTFKNYYQREKLGEMDEILIKVKNHIEENKVEDLDEFTLVLAESNNVQIEVQDVISGDTICSTNKFDKNKTKGHGTMTGQNSMIGGGNKYEIIDTIGNSNGIKKEIIYYKSSGVKFLTSSKIIEDFNIAIRIPINILDDAVTKSLNLMMMVFIPITVLAMILTIIFANQFTKPIIEIRKKTSRIESLDFQGDLTVKCKDEICDLANGVNNLSHKIESTLKDINTKNQRLEEMIHKEKHNEEARKEFVSSVSHELKSPIAVISGYAQALEAGVISSEADMKYYVGIINEEAGRMQIIVNDLLDLYKLESNTFKLNIKVIELHKLVENIIKKNSIRFVQEKIKLKSTIEKSIVMADEVRLEQAIQNYINNALSHINENKILEISLINKKGKGCIIVYNSGKLIEERYLQSIWQGFVRDDKVRNYKENRVGLGLAIVKQIINLHNGSCGVENQECGVKFWIKLDVVKN